jgi:3-hydroxybutyryl-CoA dehydrogenase
MYKSARWLVENDYCTYQDLDMALKNGLRHPMGLFELDDFTGVDLSFNVMQTEYKKTGEKPPMYDIYKEMVGKGRLGRKTGHGFYDYE